MLNSDGLSAITLAASRPVFGVFHVKNEGKRSTKITNIYADFTGIDQQQAMETLREYVAGGGADGEEAARGAASHGL